MDTVNPTACTNVNCKRPEFNQQLCWNSASSESKQINIDLSALDGLFGRTVKAQGGAFAGIEIIFHLTDTKFKVPSDRGLKEMVWNLYAVIDVANQECRPIDSS